MHDFWSFTGGVVTATSKNELKSLYENLRITDRVMLYVPHGWFVGFNMSKAYLYLLSGVAQIAINSRFTEHLLDLARCGHKMEIFSPIHEHSVLKRIISLLGRHEHPSFS